MTTEIQKRLLSIEREHDVKILLAVESGSRAWGFESKNSDWDVRFIYVHQPEWYFTVDEQRDVIEQMCGDLDLVGWELRKALRLLKRSNPSFLEWVNSPIVFHAVEPFLTRIRAIVPEFFNPIASMYHYNHMYTKHDGRYLQREDCTMRRFLYYLRGILACKWIETRKTLPPVAFEELVEAMVDDVQMRVKIADLVRLKKDGEEYDIQMVDKDLMDYARSLADYYNEHIGTFRPELHERPSKALDALLYEMVQTHKSPSN